MPQAVTVTCRRRRVADDDRTDMHQKMHECMTACRRQSQSPAGEEEGLPGAAHGAMLVAARV